DTPSADALLFALRRLLAEPLAAVLAVREGEPSLLDRADIPTLAVGGLGVEEAASLLGAVPPEIARRLHGATAGNPLALLELSGDAGRLAGRPEDEPLPV